MSTTYEMLGVEGATHIRKQRLLDLEADHYRFMLDLQELPPDADGSAVLQQIAEIERRIAVHRTALGMEPVVTVDPSTEDRTADTFDEG